jgi:hypothetical protein
VEEERINWLFFINKFHPVGRVSADIVYVAPHPRLITKSFLDVGTKYQRDSIPRMAVKNIVMVTGMYAVNKQRIAKQLEDVPSIRLSLVAHSEQLVQNPAYHEDTRSRL